MKKNLSVFLNTFAAINLGDDLFLKIISDRYKNQFVTTTNFKYNTINNNLKIITTSNIVVRIFNKLIRIITLEKMNLITLIKDKHPIFVNLGGSIFMEGKNLEYWKNIKIKDYYNKKAKNYVIGANVGPYTHKEFLTLLDTKLFQKCEDICFRDQYSKSIFKNNKIRVAPDIVFALDITKYPITEQNKVIISVINFDIRDDLKKYEKQYEKKIIEIINYFIKKDYEIVLMSFCKAEGDEKTISNITKQLSPKIKIKIHNYEGNIDKALQEFASSKIVIATRYHAMILALLFKKAFIPLIYSKKMTNVLNDMKYKGIMPTIENIEELDVNKINIDTLKENIKINNYITQANKHFLKLDEILERK